MRFKRLFGMLLVTGALVVGGAALANAASTSSTSSKSSGSSHRQTHKVAPARPDSRSFRHRFRHDLRRAFGQGGAHHCPGMDGSSSGYAPGPPPQSGV